MKAYMSHELATGLIKKQLFSLGSQ
jgi:hypothetical protein